MTMRMRCISCLALLGDSRLNVCPHCGYERSKISKPRLDLIAKALAERGYDRSKALAELRSQSPAKLLVEPLNKPLDKPLGVSRKSKRKIYTNLFPYLYSLLDKK